MGRRVLYIVAAILLLLYVPQRTYCQKPSVYEISRMPFSVANFSDISPVIVKNGILFCSNRRFSVLKDRTAFDGHRLYNIYFSQKKDSSGWGTPKEVISERSSNFNNGPMCVAPDGKTVYFTSEVETGSAAKKNNFKNHNGIFIGVLSGTNLNSVHPFEYNGTSYEVGQPSISHDGKYLFFASDMPGGQGKSDLYYCELINGAWSKPVNMGPKINSPEVENYPYMHPSGKLYFSSDRPGGKGKLDIYSTSLYNGNWDDPVLLPDPLNSASDDFAFVASENLQTGYFSSNRYSNDEIFSFTSTMIRKSKCDTLVQNNFCYRFEEENAVKFDTMPFRYEWKFGDGQKADGPMVEHCYIKPGRYIIHLDVVNLITKETMYNEKTDTLVLAKVEQPYITGPDKFNAGQAISLNADSTNLPGWKIAQYYWNFGDETIDTGREVNKSYSKPGTYNIQLIVTDERGQGGQAREACVSKNIIIIR